MLQILDLNDKNFDSLEDLNRTLFIEQHPDFPTYALVNSLADVELDSVDDDGLISLFNLGQLYNEAEDKGFSTAAFLDDHTKILSWLKGIDDPYPYDLNITLKHFQLQGFNYTKDLPASLINWSTGSGKTIIAIARAKYMLEKKLVDKVIIASKNHNKINWQRSLDVIGNLSSVVDESGTGNDAEGKRLSRAENYQNNKILIVNYEKFRFRSEFRSIGGDGDELGQAIKGKKILWIFDEMPSKLRTTNTEHFKGLQKLLRLPKKNYKVALTATKIETDPENIYTCMKILDPTIWSNKQKFRQMYAKSMSSFSPWQVATWDHQKLHDLGMRISHMTHVANKYTDPLIRAEFPEEHWEDVIIDMSSTDRTLYNKTLSEVSKDLSSDYNSLITKMSVLQMICNNPATVTKSKGALAQVLSSKNTFTDRYSAKLDTLKEMLENIDGKIVLFSMFNDYGAKMLMPYLASWNMPFVLYDGSKKQAAEDRFREDDRIKVFLSSDQGSDSINLEKATSVINYDLPYNYSTLLQRVNRINRITSESAHVFYYNLIMANTIEERKLKILNKKKKYEDSIDGKIEDISDSSIADLKWILLGDS